MKCPIPFSQRGVALAVFFSMACAVTHAATYYVDSSAGNDSNNGLSQSRPWKTLAKVSGAALAAGDAVLFKRGEIWRGQLLITKSGTAVSPITFGAYGTGGKPVFNGAAPIAEWTPGSNNLYSTGMPAEPDVVAFNGVKGTRQSTLAELNAPREWYWENNLLAVYAEGAPENVEAASEHFVVAGNNISYVRIQDLEVKFAADPVCMNETRYVTLENLDVHDSAGLSAILIISYTAGKGEYNTVRNCTASHIDGSAESLQSGNNGCGIFLYGEMCKNNLVTGSTAHDCGHEGILILGGSHNLIAGNTVHHCGQSGFRVALETATGNVLENNHSHENAQTTDDRYGVDLIRVGNNNLVRYNLVHDQHDTLNDPAIPANDGRTKYGSGGIRFDGGDWEGGDYMDSTGNQAYYNVVHNETTGLLSFNFSNIGFFNNTVYNSKTTGLGIISASATISSNNAAKNNLIHTLSGQALVRYRATDNQIDYNRYFSAGSVTFSWASAIVNFAAWKTASGQDGHSSAGDPLWINASAQDFHLRSASPCIDAGIDLGLTRDCDGGAVPQRNGVDIGAFEAPPPTISVTSPNGGETWATGQRVTFQWSYTGDPGTNVTVELLHGAAASTLAASVPVGNNGSGGWDWVIPLSQASDHTYRIRVTSLDYPDCNDSSDAVFTITAPTISVMSPNGGETWYGGETHPLRWTYTGDPGADVKIELLIGSIPVVIAASASAGSAGSGQYDWTIPVTQSAGSAYKIRVTSNSNAYCLDTSAAAFSIFPASLAVNTPNGGETWRGGEIHSIEWTYAGLPGATAKIELLKSGTPTLLSSNASMGTDGVGRWDWGIPADQISGADYRIRITSNDVSAISDASNADFALQPAAIAVTAPNGGETWRGGETHTVRWNYTGAPGSTVNIELLNGTTPAMLAANLSIGLDGAGGWDWSIPADIPAGAQYRIRVSSVSTPSCVDDSDGNFVLTAPDLLVISPNGGESWTTGETHLLRWSYTGNPGAAVQIELLNGASPQVLASTVPLEAGEWPWQIPFSVGEGSEYKIRVSSVSNPWCGDVSDGLVSIASVPTDTLALASPVGGEHWTRGETHRIQWIYAGDPGAEVSIELLDGGVASMLAASVPVGAAGAGHWDWAIPAQQSLGTQFRVRVSSLSNPVCRDSSPNDFRIDTASITVTAPTAGAQWYTGETHAVQWISSGFPGDAVRIELLEDGTPLELATNIPITTGSWDWTVPNDHTPGGGYALRVSSMTNALYSGSSAAFSIAPSAITVRAPNGGETWIDGEMHAITWEYAGHPGENLQIELLDGASAVILASAPVGENGAGAWNWTVPPDQPAGTNYRIRVSSATAPSVSDVSNAAFEIEAPSITMTTPNGGESWVGGQTQLIQWNYAGYPGNYVSITLLKDGVPSTLADNVDIGADGMGSWSWTIPANQAAGTTYRVQVASLTTPSCASASAGDFAIAAPSITLTHPNGGNSFSTGGVVNIRWSYTGHPGANVEIALLDGSNVSVLNANAPVGSNGSGVWNWAIPLSQAPGTNYRIRIVSTGLTSCSDASDAPFNITAPALTLTSPNGAETWTAGNSYSIQWAYAGAPGANVRLELLNGGVASTLASSVSVGSGGMGSWTWAIPPGVVTGSNFTLRITSTTNAYCLDSSDGTFTINPPPPTITMKTPNGGETWHTGETRQLEWDYTNEPGENVRIELLQGAAVTVIGASVPSGSGGTGSWSWVIPPGQSLGTNYRIRITSIATPACTDTSNADFAIAASVEESLTVISPNGEENWLIRDTHPITWRYTGNPGANVRIELLRGGSVASVLASSVSIGSGGQGAWSWTPSFFLESRSDYTIRITSTSTPSVTDTSDDLLTVTRWSNIQVEYPNGGEQWVGGETRTLRWSYAGDVGSSVRIILQRGSSNTTLASGLGLGTDGQGFWTWTLPGDQLPADNYRIRLETNSFFSASDTSDANFTIGAPGINIVTSAEGTQQRVGETLDIQWTYTGYPGPNVRIELIENGVASVLASSVPLGASGKGAWSWAVPLSATNAAGCAVRVTSTALASCSGTSAAFDLVAPVITVITPGGGEDWKCGETREIRWSCENDPGSLVRIELFSEGTLAAVLAEMAAAGQDGAGTWHWAIAAQQAPGNHYRIRITSVSNPYCFASSGADFQISMQPPRIREIAVEPDSAKAISGDSLQLTVYLDAGTPPFTYRWFQDGIEAMNSNAPSYVLAPARPEDSGSYTCQVSNAAGMDLSEPVVLLVVEPLSLSEAPCGGNCTAGGTHVFRAMAAGGFAPYAYAWRKEGQGTPLCLEAVFTLSGLDAEDNGRYYVVVTDSEGSHLESEHVTLIVSEAVPVLGGGGLTVVMTLLLLTTFRALSRRK